jgi:P pilus assembly chaperone PapD
MNKFIRSIFKIVSSVSASGLMIMSPASAQQFSVSPLVTISGSVSGQSKGSINVTNKGQENLRVRIYAESFTYDRQKGFVFTAADDRSAVPYLQFSPREMEIPPGVTRNVRVAVTLPSRLGNQEYRAAVFIEDLKERQVRSNNGGALSIRARVASVFFVGKGTGSANIQAVIASWDVANKKLNLLLENKGNQTAYPEVRWSIEKNGKEIAKDVFRGVVVQSENSREISLQSGAQPLNLAPGEYKLSGDILITGQKPIPFNIKVVIP